MILNGFITEKHGHIVILTVHESCVSCLFMFFCMNDVCMYVHMYLCMYVCRYVAMLVVSVCMYACIYVGKQHFPHYFTESDI